MVSILNEINDLLIYKFYDWGFTLYTTFEKKRNINARVETLIEKPSFNQLLQTNRCIVVCEGYTPKNVV